ncbi:MAG TPA: hypothetical protein VJ302_07820 [Blastocatellia bacterium]|nr:hypothetical protein [Blastocatellia bacterium]
MTCLISVMAISLAYVGAHAQLKLANGSIAIRTVKTVSTVNDLVSLLPASDIVATIDVNRAVNELLPKLAELGVDTSHLSEELDSFASKTKVDPNKIQSAVMGFSLSGTQAKGVIIVQGVDLDSKKLEAGIKAYRAEFKTTEHKGIPIFMLPSNKVKSPTAGPLSVKTDETSIVALGQQRLAFGDLSVIKSVIEISTGAAKGGVSPTLAGALNETRSTALIRYALNLPENVRQEAANQGDLFKSIAAIKVILGTFDVAKDLTLSLDTVMRTASQGEAGELENGLKGVLTLAQGFLGGNDPKLEIFKQLLDQVKVASKTTDVSLSINVPRPLLEQLTKKKTASK